MNFSKGVQTRNANLSKEYKYSSVDQSPKEYEIWPKDERTQ